MALIWRTAIPEGCRAVLDTILQTILHYSSCLLKALRSDSVLI